MGPRQIFWPCQLLCWKNFYIGEITDESHMAEISTFAPRFPDGSGGQQTSQSKLDLF